MGETHGYLQGIVMAPQTFRRPLYQFGCNVRYQPWDYLAGCCPTERWVPRNDMLAASPGCESVHVRMLGV